MNIYFTEPYGRSILSIQSNDGPPRVGDHVLIDDGPKPVTKVTWDFTGTTNIFVTVMLGGYPPL